MHCLSLRSLSRVIFGVLLTGAIARAQELTISGTVTDQKKAVVAGVSVTLRNPSGTLIRKTTEASGEFIFDGLKAGAYEITFAKEDYQSTTQTLTLTNESRVVDVALALGRITTTLEVTDSAGFNPATRLYVDDLEVPVLTSVISQQTLRDQNINDLLTALENVSGVTTSKQYGSMEWYTIGGFTQQSGNEFLYIDGMASTGNRGNTQLTNIESIEVIKGPAALLMGTSGSGGSGAGSAGGIVNVTRKKPQSQPLQEVFYRAGRWGLQEVGASSTGRVFNMNRLLYQADFGFSRSDGWRDVGTKKFNLSPVLTYLLNEHGRVTVQESFTRDRFETDGGLPTALFQKQGFPLDRKLNPRGDFDKYRDWQTQVRFEYNLPGNLRLQNQFFTQVKRTEYLNAESPAYNATTNMVTRNAAYLVSNRRPKQDYVTLSGSHHFLGTNHQWTASYNYQEHFSWSDRSGPASGSTSQSIAVPALDLNAWLQPGFVDVAEPTNFPRTAKVFTAVSYNNFNLQDQIRLTSRLSLNVVVSRAFSKRRTHTDSYDINTGMLTTRGPEGSIRPQNSTNYRAGLSYLLTERGDAAVYFNTSTNFVPLTAIPTNLDPSIDPNDLKSPINRSYVFGGKWQTRGGRLKMDMEVGKKMAQNQLITVASPTTGLAVQVQAGQQTSRTADFDLEGYIGWGVRGTAVYGYAACRYDNFTSSLTNNLSGRRCAYASRHSTRAYLTKQIKVGSDSRLSLSFGGTYRSKAANSTAAVQTYIPSWIRFDAGATYEMTRKWSAGVNIQNLFDRQRYVPNFWGTLIYPGAPISATLTLRYQFNHDSF